MEVSGSQQEKLGDRARPSPSLPRVPSRSSTSSTKTRMNPQSANSSTSQLGSQSQQATASHTHKFHHSNCHQPLTPRERPRSQLSRESRDSRESRETSDESRSIAPPVSSFLQERLQRERKVESERSSSRMSNDPMSASLDLRAVQSSPVRTGAADSRRPRSSGGGEPTKKKGLGLKEMEQTLSTLHKQNFDLKLELFHRRECQSNLEERADKAEAEKAELEDANDKLQEEVEKRDKALEEAVAMIVRLEAENEQLRREREMVRQIDADGFFYSGSESHLSEARMSTPKMKLLGLPSLRDDDKAVARMPSFLSDRSEGTQNLRNVYLGVHGSLLSLPKTSEEARDTEGIDLNGIKSPSLSVLSESSFLSVYGQKLPNTSSSPAPESDDLSPLDGISEKRNNSVRKGLSSENHPKSKAMTPTKNQRSSPNVRGQGSGQFQNIGDILDMDTSPLQRLEKMEMTLTAMDAASRPGSQEKVVEGQTIRPTPPTRMQTQPKTKQEKREALRRVLTDAPIAKEPGHPHGLPPTPDTISTSTLRNYKNSNDTLSHQQAISNERSYLTLSETTASRTASRDQDVSLDLNGNAASRHPFTSAFNGQREFSGTSSYFEDRLPIPQRPRSADETTVSHNRRNEWDSDSSDDDLDRDSAVSGHDYWLRESLRPNRVAAAMAAVDDDGGRISPDLFSFPMSTAGWATDAMFGSLGGGGFMGAAPGPLAQTLDALGESLPAPQTGLFGSGLATPVLGTGIVPPPPPNRRSSLHARTGSSHGTAPFGSGSGSATPVRPSAGNGRPRKSPERKSRARSNSIDSRPHPGPQAFSNAIHQSLRQVQQTQANVQQRGPQSRTQQNPAQDPPQKQRHYPPLAGQNQHQAPRGRTLNALFRRSTGTEVSLPAPSSAPPTETTFASSSSAKQQQSMVGVPSWGRRADLDDDRASATPPPIMRNRVAGRGSVDDMEAAAATVAMDMAVGGDVGGGGRLMSMPARVPGQNGAAFGVHTSISTGAGATNGGVANGASTSGSGAGTAGGQQPQQQQQQGKRKWLGLGRVASLRNRAA